MKFAMGGNHDGNDTQTANELIADTLDESVYAEEVGLHSAGIGEHHFSTLGVLSCPASQGLGRNCGPSPSNARKGRDQRPARAAMADS